MSELQPVAFDIETSGLGGESVITVAGLANEVGAWFALNTAERDCDIEYLKTILREHSNRQLVQLTTHNSEPELLKELRSYVNETLDTSNKYITAYNGERYRGGFDLPYLRTACVRCNVKWVFEGLAYVDTMTAVQRFNTGEFSDLVRVYDALIGKDSCDPFTDSKEAVTAFENGEWDKLLLHNLADVERTYELIKLCEDYVAQSDFHMKNLAPPNSYSQDGF